MATEDEDDVRSAAKNYMAGMSDDDEEVEPEAEPKDDDKEADEAAKRSAFKDFLAALGLSPKKADKAREALTEYLDLCKDE